MEEQASNESDLADLVSEPESGKIIPADVDVPAPEPDPVLWAVTDTGYRVILSEDDLLPGEELVRDELPAVYTQRADAAIQKMQLTQTAAAAIAPLQDAVDVDMATAEDAALLVAWKKFRVLVNRIDPATAPNIDWPEQPAT